MKSTRSSLLIAVGIALFLVPVVVVPVLAHISPVQSTPLQPQACSTLGKPSDLPQPALINFDDLANSAVIGGHYYSTFGVSFEDTPTNRAIIYGNEPVKAASPPNVASNNAVFPNTSNNVPLVLDFREPKSHVGMYIGNSNDTSIIALLTAYNASGNVICQARYTQVPEAATLFVGFYDTAASIVRVTLDYGDTSLSEVIDDLYLAPRLDLPASRRPLPKWTPIPSPTPTAGPKPTATAVVPMVAYQPVKQVAVILQPVLPDLSIHGIEITQGIQCFDTSKGLAGCANNSLPVVAKKDTTARLYLKISGPSASMSNVPVRLYLIANGVTYQANASGKATTAIHQGASESADVYFNVNFSSTIAVDFYAIVDPNNTISETNEGNNRYPASGTIRLDFQNRTSMKIVGERLDYHPSGYSGTQHASGWAVNGGAADWFEQLLPIRNNGINYAVASGYLDWTNSLTPCSSTTGGNNQHSLISTLNLYWTLENLLSFWFTGAFTGATHVYGWVPNAGYPCGHADMPVYPHAGGLGVVGIGTDAPGSDTNNPGSGALIFGHELIHDYDLKHTNTADACGSNDSSSGFPYANSSIQEFGFNPITGKVYDPATTHDVMSYCPSGGSKQGWMSPYTWQQMFNDLSSPIALSSIPQGAVPTGVLAPSAANESLQVQATIFNPLTHPDAGGKLGELHKIGAGASLNLPAGPYAIELRNAAGGILISQSFDVNFESEYDAHNGPTSAPPFPPDPTDVQDVSFIMPWDPGTAFVSLTYQGMVLDQKAVSANPPQVMFTNPTGQENWLAGSTHTLSWQGLDLDGDPLSYSLSYSDDGGLSWGLLAAGLIASDYLIQTDAMAGGSDVRFRVIATDGVLTGVDETDEAISIPNKPPQATILNPSDGGIYPPGSLVVLQGIGTDMEDGTLPDEALKWSSDIQGSLGGGPSLALNTLQTGIHHITLWVEDSYGVVSSTTVKVFIVDPVFLPRITK